MPIYLLSTLDTKGPEAAFIRDRLKELGLTTTVVDTGCLGEPLFKADVSRAEVFQAAGSALAELVQRNDRGGAVTAAAAGARKIVAEAHAQGRLDGIIGLG